MKVGEIFDEMEDIAEKAYADGYKDGIEALYLVLKNGMTLNSLAYAKTEQDILNILDFQKKQLIKYTVDDWVITND